MSNYTDRLDKISTGHFTGSANYDMQPSGMLQAISERHYAKVLANGFNRTDNVSDALLKEVNKDNSKVLDVAILKRSTQTYS